LKAGPIPLLLRDVRLKTATLLVLLVAPLAACGKSALTNEQLGDEVTKTFNAHTPFVCWTKSGYLKYPFAHAYDHVCGVSRNVSQVFLVVDAKKRSWCIVTPREKKLPNCPLPS
jgi:hypothetical protein